MKKNFWFIITGVIILIGLFFILKPKSPPPPTIESIQQISTESAQPKVAKTFELVINNKKLVSGLDTLVVTEGDEVIINVVSDEDEQLHIHGYDKSIELAKDQKTSLSFEANLTGRFPFELENSKTEIGVLEVQPK